jgi:hypothetical protein
VKKNEDGEVELILGNGQLLGVFFIVVILLALFFGMGYVMGRNSGSATSVEVASVRKPEVKPPVVDSPAPKPDDADKAPGSPSSPGSVSPADAAVTEKAQEPAKQQKTSPADAKSPHTSITPLVEDSPTGTFLQLAATTRREAELEVDVLRKKSFRATAMEVPEKPGTFRVLVGPLADGGVNKAREELQGAGFPGKSAIVRKF